MKQSHPIRYLTRRLKRLATIMDSFDLAQTTARLQSILEEDRQNGDEIDRLAFTFKQLVDRIQIQMENLKQSDTLRRELIANVSHDLRTPLATLQGYIETLFLKNKSLTEEEQQHHLEIAIRHCERLWDDIYLFLTRLSSCLKSVILIKFCYKKVIFS